jgi:hypothetical protein
MLTDSFDYIFLPLILTAVFLGLGYNWARTVRRGQPLRPSQKKMLAFATLFVLGEAYIMAWMDELSSLFRWDHAWLGAIITWGVFLSIAAWWMHRHTHHGAAAADQER